MTFDYNELLRQKIYYLRSTLELDDYSFVVDSEQAFVKYKDLDPNTIYVLTRELQNDNGIGMDTQPVQILVLTEQDSLEIAKSFFTQFAKDYNFEAISQEYTEDDESHSIWVKQQYSDPVVLSNFNTINYGYRSILYISATLYIMYDVVDLHDVEIDGTAYTVLTWNLAYGMTPNTQQLVSEFISKSEKSISTLAITLTIPMVESDLISKIMAIIDESDDDTTDEDDSLSYGGNENFYFDFYLGSYHFENKKMKLTAVDFSATVDNIPVMQLGFMK